MNVVVLAGGYSGERDVSLSSGAQVANALTTNGHKILLVDSYLGIDKIDTFENLYEQNKQDVYSYKIPATEPDLEKLKKERGNGNDLIGKNVIEVCKMADIVFIALHGGIGEDGRIQALFDIFDIKYTGSSYAGCLLSMDKEIAKDLMIINRIPTPPSTTIDLEATSKENAIKGLQEFVFPCVVKPCNGGSSGGTTIVKSKEGIEKAIDDALVYEDKILVEKFIEGREFAVGVLDGVALPAIEIIPPETAEFFDFESKYQGTTSEVCPADIPEEIEQKLRELSLKVHNALKLGFYSRSDFIVDAEGEIYCLEANSLPGMTNQSLLPQEARESGISYNDLCEKIIALA